MRIDFFVIFSALSLFVCACNSPRVERTTGKDKDAVSTYVIAHLVSVARISPKVKFITDGKLGAGAWGEL